MEDYPVVYAKAGAAADTAGGTVFASVLAGYTPADVQSCEIRSNAPGRGPKVVVASTPAACGLDTFVVSPDGRRVAASTAGRQGKYRGMATVRHDGVPMPLPARTVTACSQNTIADTSTSSFLAIGDDGRVVLNASFELRPT